MTADLKKKALVLLPKGPHGWASHGDILPELIKLWIDLGFEILPLYLPKPRLEEKDIVKIRSAKVLIFPLGQIHYDGLQFLEQLRNRHGIKVPACIMHTSDISVGARYLKRFERTLTKNDTLIVNCRAEEALLKRYFPKIQLGIRVIPLPINEKLFFMPKKPADIARLRHHLKLPRNEKIILYAGRISLQKNITALLLLFRQILERDSQYRLVLLGPADNIGIPHLPLKNRKFLADLSEAISLLGLEANVEFRHEVSQSELADYFRCCDVSVSLTLHSGEDFGYAIAQGLSCGIPTVVSMWGGGLDLGTICHGVRVKNARNGPEIDLKMAKKKLALALRQKRKGLAKNFQKSEISKLWYKVVRAYDDFQMPAIEKNRSLGRAHLLERNFFESSRDPNFRKFVAIYSGER